MRKMVNKNAETYKFSKEGTAPAQGDNIDHQRDEQKVVGFAQPTSCKNEGDQVGDHRNSCAFPRRSAALNRHPHPGHATEKRESQRKR